MPHSEALRIARAVSPQHARPAHHLPLGLLVIALAVLAALILVRLGFTAFGLFVRDAGMSADPQPVPVTLGSVQMAVPDNMIALASERGGHQQKLDLFVHWPTLEGFSPERASEFQPGAVSGVFRITLRPAGGAMSPQARFHAVYPRVLEDEATTRPDGTAVRRFRDGFGYDDEVLYVGPRAEPPLFARCLADSLPSAPSCLTDFRTEHGLDVTYRFRPSMLDEWPDMDLTVRALVDGLVKADDGRRPSAPGAQ